MELEKKRSLALGILIAVVIILSLIYFFWGNLINRGNIEISATPPFQVEIFNGETFQCNESPCIIQQKIGDYSLIISKEGYLAEVFSVDVDLWKSTTLNVPFSIDPYIEKTENYPKAPATISYQLIPAGSGQKLIQKSAKGQKTVANFPQKIQDPKVFGDENAAIIIGKNSAYKINLIENTRQSLQRLNASAFKFSQDGRYAVFQSPSSDKLWLIKPNASLHKLDLNISLEQVAWDPNNKLYFVTDQAIGITDNSADNSLRLLEQKEPNFYTFGHYNPTPDKYFQLFQSRELSALPSHLAPMGSGHELYYKIGEEKFKIILRKF